MKQVLFNGAKCNVVKSNYQHGNGIALELFKGNELWAIATINVPDFKLADDEVIIKDYSENRGMYKALLDADIIHPLNRHASSGFIKAPVCKLKI